MHKICQLPLRRELILFWTVPLILCIGQVILELSLSSKALAAMHSEAGIHETLQAIFLAIGLFYAVKSLLGLNVTSQKFLTFWLALAALSCLYVLGEEISWGQHIFNWSTPEYWQAVNDQQETNLHNTSSWLDQKPRLILLIGVLVGGLIIPFLRYKSVSFVPDRFEIIYPDFRFALIAVFIVLITVIDKVDDAMDSVVIMERASEVQELYLFYFVMLYLIVLNGRIKS